MLENKSVSDEHGYVGNWYYFNKEVTNYIPCQK